MRRVGADERGSALIEFMIGIPLLLLAVASGFQLFLVATSDASAKNAARAGARAASLQGDGVAVASDSLAVWLRPSADITAGVGGGAAEVRVEVRAPRVLPMMPAEVLSRSHLAVMPTE